MEAAASILNQLDDTEQDTQTQSGSESRATGTEHEQV
jgi:hypothetical protein